MILHNEDWMSMFCGEMHRSAGLICCICFAKFDTICEDDNGELLFPVSSVQLVGLCFCLHQSTLCPTCEMWSKS